MRSCRDCQNFSVEEVSVDSADYYTGPIWALHCDKKPSVGTLKQFPFKQTNCTDFIDNK